MTLSLEIPAAIHACGLRVINYGCFEEIPLVGIDVLETIEMLVRIIDSVRIERIDIEHSETLIGQPFGVSLGRFTVDTRDFVAQYMLGPLDFLIHSDTHHVENQLLVVDIWEFFIRSTRVSKKANPL